ncbi:P-loop containing nucleoside triphosphate hydrolase protein [Auricularia subglabra TFB-10046 SS5]|nr:P-loop containing nucleoside triphosphate hydrolase protein [Auricularia subglabra TFB-10046 SS5]
MSADTDSQEPLVILVGVGGATCSGKTTLAKQLRRVLPDSAIVHQDDFAPPQDALPLHPVYGVQDWDDPPGAIDWPRFVAFLRDVGRTGAIPPGHRSHDHMNIQQEVAFDGDAIGRWRARFAGVAARRRVRWVLVDGFLLYWDKDADDALDVRFLLRVPKDVLVERRIARQGYYTAEGEMWVDPPYYFDGIVYPAYVKAHQHLFAAGDVERGALLPAAAEAGRLVLFDALEMSADDLLEKACQVLLDHVEGAGQ